MELLPISFDAFVKLANKMFPYISAIINKAYGNASYFSTVITSSIIY